MKRSFLTTSILTLLFAGLFGNSVYLQHQGLQAVRSQPPFWETWTMSGRSGDVMKLMALRYDMVAADFLWLRAIQSFGGRGMTNRDWHPMYNMFDAITELDPLFESAYTFGNLVIGDEGHQQREGLKLLLKGSDNIYMHYRCPFEGLYVSHWSLRDEELARWFGRVAIKRKDAPDWVSRMVAYIDVDAGQYYIGFDRFVGNLTKGIDTDEPALERIALFKLNETINKWNCDILSKATDQYTSQTGKLPQTIDDLTTMPALQNYEVARMSRLLASAMRYTNFLGKKELTPLMLQGYVAPDPKLLNEPVEQTSVTLKAKTMDDLQNVIFRESLVRGSGIPENPSGEPYILNVDKMSLPGVAATDIYITKNDLEEFAKDLLQQIRSAIAKRKAELGRNPKDLHEVFYTDFKTTEPLGGHWIYNPQDGTIKMSSRPML